MPEIQELERNIENMRERQKKLMQQEEQAQQARNDLITNVSHDLRTPLTSILGYLSYIHEDRYRDEIELRYYTELVYGKRVTCTNLLMICFLIQGSIAWITN